MKRKKKETKQKNWNPFWTNDTKEVSDKLWIPTSAANITTKSNSKGWFTHQVSTNLHSISDKKWVKSKCNSFL